jgi:hypothetical protein
MAKHPQPLAAWLVPLCVIAAVAVALAACTATPSLAPGTVAWGDRVPTPNPSAVAAQPVLARTPTTITLLPVSPRGAALGVPYRYEMPHCGLLSPVDIDGSFWDAADPAHPTPHVDGTQGVFQLTTADLATYTADDGRSVELARHAGAKTFGFCM